jgi:hypothetical protein
MPAYIAYPYIQHSIGRDLLQRIKMARASRGHWGREGEVHVRQRSAAMDGRTQGKAEKVGQAEIQEPSQLVPHIQGMCPVAARYIASLTVMLFWFTEGIHRSGSSAQTDHVKLPPTWEDK